MGFLKSISFSLASQIVSAAFQVLTGIITARLLGVEGRGIYSLFFSNGAIAATVTYFGITQALIYDRNRKNIDNAVLVGNGMIFLLFQAVLFAALLTATPRDIATQVIGGNSPWLVAGFWALVIALLGDMILTGLLLGNHLYGTYSSYIALQNIAFFMAALPAFLFVVSGEWAVGFRLVVLLLLCLGLWWVSLRKLSCNSMRVVPRVFLETLSFGSKSYIQNVIGIFNHRVGLALIGVFSTLSEAAIYSVALLIISSIRLIPDAVGTVLLPKLTTLESDEHTRISKLVFKAVIFCNVAMCAVLIPLTGPLILLLFGNDYASAIVPTQVMLIGGLFGSAYQILTRVFTSDAKQEYSILAAGVGLCGVCVVSVLFIPEFGVLGAAAGFVVGNILTTLPMVGFFCRSRKVPLMELLVPTRAEIEWVREQFKAVFLSRGSK